MPIEYPGNMARYYDACPAPFDDVSFYLACLPHAQARVLELGCGTGRVLFQLVAQGAAVHGVDASVAMLTVCREKLQHAGMTAPLTLADITTVDLGQQFDLIIAPFRVMQNLATDEEVDGLFQTLHQHLAPGGTAILNVFRPLQDRVRMLAEWCRLEQHDYTLTLGAGRLERAHTRPRINADPLVCYPELIYRYYEEDRLIEELTVGIAMRCYYPDEFLTLIESHGFRVLDKWGGYADEPYGEGGELVVRFTTGDSI